MRDFDNDMDYGTEAEKLVRSWFGGELGHNDLLCVADIKNTWHGAEVCIEEDSIVEENKKGWIYTSTADNIIFLDFKNKQGILANLEELRKRYTEIKDRYEIKIQESTRDGRTWHSRHRKIPINKFCYCFFKYYGE